MDKYGNLNWGKSGKLSDEQIQEIIGDAEEVVITDKMVRRMEQECKDRNKMKPSTPILDIQRISLKPGDVLFVRVPQDTDPFERAELEGIMRQLFPDNDVLIGDENTDIMAISPVCLTGEGNVKSTR